MRILAKYVQSKDKAQMIHKCLKDLTFHIHELEELERSPELHKVLEELYELRNDFESLRDHCVEVGALKKDVKEDVEEIMKYVKFFQTDDEETREHIDLLMRDCHNFTQYINNLEIEAGKIKGPGIPDGTGPNPDCPIKKESEEEILCPHNKEAKEVSKKEYTDTIIKHIEKVKEYFPFVTKVYEVTKGYIIESGFDGMISRYVIKKLSSDPKFAHFDIISPRKIQIVFAK